MTESVERIVLGKVLAPFGLQGWVKVHSESRPMTDIGRYRVWQLKLKGAWVDAVSYTHLTLPTKRIV